MLQLNDRKLVFLEKDYKCPASDESIKHAKYFLKKRLKLTKEQIDEMQIFYQYSLMTNDEVYAIIFNPLNVIVSYSMYVSGSNGEFNYFMAATGRNDIKGLTYIDSSGMLVEYLNRYLMKVEKNVIDIISGINMNNIISFDSDGDFEPKLLKIEIRGRYDNCVKLIELSPENIIPIKVK